MGVRITRNDQGKTVVNLPVGINWVVEPSGAITVLGGESVSWTPVHSQSPGTWDIVELTQEVPE